MITGAPPDACSISGARVAFKGLLAHLCCYLGPQRGLQHLPAGAESLMLDNQNRVMLDGRNRVNTSDQL